MTRLNPVPDTGPDMPEGPFDLPVDPAGGLPMPRIQVWPAEGPPYVVQGYGSDMILFEETAAKHRWERLGPGTAPMRWTYFMAWAASRREGLIPPDVTWEVFKTTVKFCADVPTEPARPTPPGPDPG
jgi:hypothetical protein